MVNSKKVIVKILENKKVAGDYFKLSFKLPYTAKVAKPGQFLEIKVNNGFTPLLRKPLSIHKISGKTVEILYEVVGIGTEILSKKRPGDTLDIIGPLGNGFDYQLPITNYQLPILIAGGIGVAPLLFLVQKLVHSKKLYVLIGAKTQNQILCEKDFKKLGVEILVSTEDGSKGKKGFVTDRLKFLLSTIDHGPLTIYACGPKPMLKEVAKISAKHKIPCQVLLEEYMACGIGVCLGCAVKVKTKDEGRETKDEYKMVCKDGPVFNAKEIIW